MGQHLHGPVDRLTFTALTEKLSKMPSDCLEIGLTVIVRLVVLHINLSSSFPLFILGRLKLLVGVVEPVFVKVHGAVACCVYCCDGRVACRFEEPMRVVPILRRYVDVLSNSATRRIQVVISLTFACSITAHHDRPYRSFLGSNRRSYGYS